MRLRKCIKFEKQYKIQHHLNKALKVQVMKLFNGNIMSYFHKILKKKQKQVWLNRFMANTAQKIEPIDSSDSVSNGKIFPTP